MAGRGGRVSGLYESGRQGTTSAGECGEVVIQRRGRVHVRPQGEGTCLDHVFRGDCQEGCEYYFPVSDSSPSPSPSVFPWTPCWLTEALLLKLQENESFIIDNGHLVAWNLDYKLLTTINTGFMSHVYAKEGVVCQFRGPGTVFWQTRNPQEFKRWIKAP